MAIITTISEVPLFTTTREALNWAAENNCTGYHTHNYQGRTGYMGCVNHFQASETSLNVSTQPVIPQPQLPPQTQLPPQPPMQVFTQVDTQTNTQVNIPQVSSSGSSGSSGGGGGGGGGY